MAANISGSNYYDYTFNAGSPPWRYWSSPMNLTTVNGASCASQNTRLIIPTTDIPSQPGLMTVDGSTAAGFATSEY